MCPLHGEYCKRPRTYEGILIFGRAHAGIPNPKEDNHSIRFGKTRRDHRSGAHARRLTNRTARSERG